MVRLEDEGGTLQMLRISGFNHHVHLICQWLHGGFWARRWWSLIFYNCWMNMRAPIHLGLLLLLSFWIWGVLTVCKMGVVFFKDLSRGFSWKSRWLFVELAVFDGERLPLRNSVSHISISVKANRWSPSQWCMHYTTQRLVTIELHFED